MMRFGWFKDQDGTWYWFDNEGTMATGRAVIDGKTEVFSDSGGCTASFSAPLPGVQLTALQLSWISISSRSYFSIPQLHGLGLTLGCQLFQSAQFYFRHGIGSPLDIVTCYSYTTSC